MDIVFSSNKLARRMSSSAELLKAYGDKAKRIQMRLEVLELAANLAEVPTTPPPRRHELTGDLAGRFAVDITGNWRLLFRPDHDPVPLKDDGGIDLERITKIEVIDVDDYH